MSKRAYRTYSTELKQKVVEEYLSGRGSLRYLAKLHQIGDKKSISNTRDKKNYLRNPGVH